ncbi:hypothetical protein B1H19_05295 [Streptomyces gilvosporeus]|uniref:Uncharacterized protein n=2 Tax=Streptomyces gilvosporeus TaxID=553510 RepID=A0A1V0TL93_9ACTN|nr:hypothetical protein B1H19_05295 [Streptomyces gilvosporeus]
MISCVLSLASATVAYANEPAGNGIDAKASGTGTAAISITGTYSCLGTSATIQSVVTDNTTGEANTVAVDKACPDTGAAFSITVPAPAGRTTWGNNVTVTLTETDTSTPTTIATDSLDVVNNIDDVTTVDSDSLSGGSLVLGGTETCSTANTAHTLTLNATEADVGGGTTSATNTFDVTCPATPGTPVTWTTTLTPPAGVFTPGVISESGQVFCPGFAAPVRSLGDRWFVPHSAFVP